MTINCFTIHRAPFNMKPIYQVSPEIYDWNLINGLGLKFTGARLVGDIYYGKLGAVSWVPICI